MQSSSNLPVIVGVGQFTNRHPEDGQEIDPVDYGVEAAHRAEKDAGLKGMLEAVDSLTLIKVLSHDDPEQPRRLAAKLNAKPVDLMSTVSAGVVPQTAMNRLCERIADGKSEMGLIVGAEAFYSSAKPDWEALSRMNYGGSVPVLGETRDAYTAMEEKYGLYYPAVVYPLFANAYRHRRGLSEKDYLHETGALLAQYAQVAAENPHAWNKKAWSAKELATVTPDNRMIHFPFTKYMNANMNVDQAAAVLVMSEEKANALSVPLAKRIYPLSGSEAYDKWFIFDRENFHSVPGLSIAFREAFDQARLDPEQIDIADFYSCFPIAPQLAIETFVEMGGHPDLAPTVTGGLPFFGGAGAHYTLHAICEVTRLLRKAPHKKAMTHCLSWFLSKFAVGLYGGERPEAYPTRNADLYMHEIDIRVPDRPLLDAVSGPFTLETFTLTYGRDGEPVRAVIIATDDQGARVFAFNDTDKDLMRALTGIDVIGRSVILKRDGTSEMNEFTDLR